MTVRFAPLAAVAALATLASPALADAERDRGAYLVRIMDCGGCHTPSGPDMAPDATRLLAGALSASACPASACSIRPT